MNGSEVEALFARTIAGDYDAEDAWDAVRALRINGSPQIFEYAATWCLSDDPRKRARGADNLCQLRSQSEVIFRDGSYQLLVEEEKDSAVLYSVVHGLGHLDNAKAIPLILRYQDHPNGGHSLRCCLRARQLSR
jgi:hypothetical protein